MTLQPNPTNRRISQPFSKLNRLCTEASVRGGTLTSFGAVAKALALTPGRITQMFGHGQESGGTVVKPETLGLIVAAFRRDGVPCEIDWLYLEFDELKARLTAASGHAAPPDGTIADWELREGTVLEDLVELRLHPSRPGNEVRDSYYVDATLLFGTAVCDYDPEDGQEPRTVSIGLRNARLAIGSDSYRPLQGSMIGERIESENFRRVAGGIEITGPAPNGVLEGNPIGDHYIAVIAATNAGDEPFALSVAALRGSFVVGQVDGPDDRPGCDVAPFYSINKNAILNAFIYRHGTSRDDAGRAILAEATMKRSAKKGDSP